VPRIKLLVLGIRKLAYNKKAGTEGAWGYLDFISSIRPL